MSQVFIIINKIALCEFIYRPVGSDITAGQQVLSPGMKVRAAEVGILATVGVTKVKCYKVPRVGVMSTGNEVGRRLILLYYGKKYVLESMLLSFYMPLEKC